MSGLEAAGAAAASAARPVIRSAGSDAVLLDCGSLEGALAVLAALIAARESGELDVAELVPAAETVLVRGGEAARPDRFAARLDGLLAGRSADAERGAGLPERVIPVIYDGGDLAEVAALTGMSVDQVVARHTAAEYTVAFTGFAPGFAYLAGGDPGLVVPRRSTPRHRIPSGSVGLAGSFSGVYPRESPGGWQLLGRTELAMWDPEREDPALLQPGGAVRFAAARESLDVPGGATAERAGADTAGTGAASGSGSASESGSGSAAGAAVLEVLEPGLQTLVQDAGRPGLAPLGVSASGAADRGAFALANRLVGNPAGAAVLELGIGGFAATARATGVLALAGAPRDGRIAGPFGVRAVPAGRAFRIDAGEELRLDAPARGLRTVLALRGGIAAEAVLGSASRDTLAGLGPAPLAAGDAVRSAGLRVMAVAAPVADPDPGPIPSEDSATTRALPAPGETTVLRVVLGPRDDWFDAAGLAALLDQEWEVSPRSDRVGVRLEGEPITRTAEAVGRELPSEGLVTGAIQVPADGQPVLFLADRPLTGGYPVIGAVRDADLDLAAQLPPGARVRFAAEPSRTASPTSSEGVTP